jgi:hypothetical protein
MEATSYTAKRRTRLALVPPIARTDQLARSNGLVTVVENPELVAHVLQYRGFTLQDRKGCQIARLRSLAGSIVALYVSGLLIALTPDSSSALELLATVWPHVKQEARS